MEGSQQLSTDLINALAHRRHHLSTPIIIVALSNFAASPQGKLILNGLFQRKG